MSNLLNDALYEVRKRTCTCGTARHVIRPALSDFVFTKNNLVPSLVSSQYYGFEYSTCKKKMNQLIYLHMDVIPQFSF